MQMTNYVHSPLPIGRGGQTQVFGEKNNPALNDLTTTSLPQSMKTVNYFRQKNKKNHHKISTIINTPASELVPS